MEENWVRCDIRESREQMVEFLSGLLRIPGIGPMNGGDGEGARADYLEGFLEGFDEVVRVDVPDRAHGDVPRPNILARKKGRKKGTVWIVSHTDTVTPGDLSKWKTPPFDPVYKDGKIYGLGAEDNGQAIVSSLFAAKQFLDKDLNGMSVGVAFVADEETTSAMGIEWLINEGRFTKDDMIVVPDWGTTDGTMIEVAEKHLLWPKITVIGKQTHGSTPHRGLNAFVAGAQLVTGLKEALHSRYPGEDDRFVPPGSTFEPTRASETVGNINTIPGRFTFWLDCRIIPAHDPADVLGFIKDYVRDSGIEAVVDVEQINTSGKPSDTDTAHYKALEDAVEEVIGKRPRAVGIGGGTCANFFRLAGLNAYVWQSGGGTLHQPNENVAMETIERDTDVFIGLFNRLCVN